MTCASIVSVGVWHRHTLDTRYT